MKSKQLLPVLLLLLLTIQLSAQDSLSVENPRLIENPEEAQDLEEEQDYKPYNALAPAKAAFYSAILPGLGQIYNGRIWKVPLVYAGIGIPIYFYIDNDRQYDRYRTAYKQRLAGREDEFAGRISDQGLRSAQELYQRNKEISILVAIGFYALNIIDANVDAHLQQFNVSEDLSLKPNYNLDKFTGKSNYGFSLNFKF
ncbi:hypothetical protein INR75_11200 [Zunongwangia sp. SCSIO 43204]|uniref:DUF5683 domain-containing protein n=1 Tax=Zunongwangia mangrovi TaxID=1334022 RepID=A0A1I1IUU9_9FLAO|nr:MULTISPECIES: DUF5683 domain-containing protein [Zunongwangia]UAB82802.1 hypothetical protein INR75_11200 [Zunongwangia sp. SCSIO 43204]SFC40057.1 hypothetical protein SAMN04487907_10473 [Zunongwangia mangrovi]